MIRLTRSTEVSPGHIAGIPAVMKQMGTTLATAAWNHRAAERPCRIVASTWHKL